MPEQIYGIENLKKFIKFACDFAKQMAVSLEDKKFTFMDIPGFFDEVLLIPGLVKSVEAAKQEFLELSPAERQELYDYLKQEFDIPNDAVESITEYAIGWGINTLSLYEMFKGLKGSSTNG